MSARQESNIHIEASLPGGSNIKISGSFSEAWVPFLNGIIANDRQTGLTTPASSIPLPEVHGEGRTASAEENRLTPAQLDEQGTPTIEEDHETNLGQLSVESNLAAIQEAQEALSRSFAVPSPSAIVPARTNTEQPNNPKRIKVVGPRTTNTKNRYTIKDARTIVIRRHHVSCTRCRKQNKVCKAPPNGPRAWKCRECANALAFCNSGEVWLKPEYLSHYTRCLNEGKTTEQADREVYGSRPGLLGGALDKTKVYSWSPAGASQPGAFGCLGATAFGGHRSYSMPPSSS
ncbi:uncharacterized protein UTRI_03690_B [Ustilago trichophora]|uniref:Uncharacterized protein n=1 Tax=Ustilago trichophora TaxID=86804 RepID=A0A5C3DZV7_9BASI|nr:uncharacterized protein UTRI_03690_B [Ustilago trichophora]